MPAAAVASLTPAITGMSGTTVGAFGEIGGDMRASGFEAKEALCITSIVRAGEGVRCHRHYWVVPAWCAIAHGARGPIASGLRCCGRQLAPCPDLTITRYGSRLKAETTTL